MKYINVSTNAMLFRVDNIIKAKIKELYQKSKKRLRIMFRNVVFDIHIIFDD